MKLGASCFSEAAKFQKILDIIQAYKESRIIIVVSSLPSVLNLLEDCAKKANTCTSYAHDIDLIKRQHLDLVNAVLEDPVKGEVHQFLSDKFTHLEEVLMDIEEYGLSDNKLDIVL